MSEENSIDYERFVHDALRGLVRRVLAQVEEEGLSGEHHFFIAFRTDHPDARVPSDLRLRYPETMTLVLQNQFSNLEVTDDAFSVTLRFDATPHHLTVPFASLVSFADPSAPFALQFDPENEPETDADASDEAGDPDEASAAEPRNDGVLVFDPNRKR